LSPLAVYTTLQALAIVGVCGLASVGRHTGGRPCPALAATLTPMRGSATATTSAGTTSRTSGGTCGGASAATSTSASTSTLSNGNLPRAAAAPAFNGHDLVVQTAKVHASFGPCAEVVRNGDSTASARTLADGDVLVESRGSLDRWLVDLLMLPDRVSSTVTRESTLLCALLWIPNWILHNVVLD
jgi:hypothetical protein